MGLKSQLGALLRGRGTPETFPSYSKKLRALQEEVARTNAELKAIRQQVREAVDDLGDRMGALSERLNSSQ